MKTYGQFCPVAKAAEIFAQRWTPLIIRELLMGSRRFSELEYGMPCIPRSLLTQRLRTLEDAGVVTRKAQGKSKRAEYHLTEAGAISASGRIGAAGISRREDRVRRRQEKKEALPSHT